MSAVITSINANRGIPLDILEDWQAVFTIKNNRQPTPIETDAFVSKVKASIEKSIEARNILQDRLDSEFEERQQRLDLAYGHAEFSKIKFVHNRDEDFKETIIDEVEISKNTIEVSSEVTKIPSTLGGETIAYKWLLDENNELYVEYAVAFCRKDEKFDPLIGMEQSIDKFERGETLRMPCSVSLLSVTKREQMVRMYRSYINQILMIPATS